MARRSTRRSDGPRVPDGVVRVLAVVAAVAVLLAVVAGVLPAPVGGDVAVAQPSPSPTDAPGITGLEASEAPTPEEPEPATDEPEVTTTAEPESPRATPTATPMATPTPSVAPATDAGSGFTPSVRRSTIPLGTVAVATAVLVAVGLGFVLVARRGPEHADVREEAGPAPRAAPPPSPDGDPTAGRAVVAFLLELGEALIDAGDAVNRVEATLRSVARRQGLAGVGVVVLPTALVISVRGAGAVQTEVAAAGGGRLRLDQVEGVLRVVDRARSGELSPSRGREELAAIRASTSPVAPQVAVAGHVLAAVGLALIMRGGLVEVGLAAALAAAAGSLQVLRSPRLSAFRAFWPLVASFLVASMVFLAARVAPGMAVLPPLVAPLIPFLPGALLTMGTIELATGQGVSGMARLGTGVLQLVLLAGGILGAAQFVGVPGNPSLDATTATTAWSGAVGVLAPWLGVGVFGYGIAWAHAARRSSLPWILLVLYVAYAGQILGGVFFGTTLSAFFGALAMTPFAVHASRQPLGPPSLVTFLPAFWLLVPGALGLEGVTRILSDPGVSSIATLVTTGSAMVAIALGILLGLLLVTAEPWRLRSVRRGLTGRSW